MNKRGRPNQMKTADPLGGVNKKLARRVNWFDRPVSGTAYVKPDTPTTPEEEEEEEGAVSETQ